MEIKYLPMWGASLHITVQPENIRTIFGSKTKLVWDTLSPGYELSIHNGQAVNRLTDTEAKRISDVVVEEATINIPITRYQEEYRSFQFAGGSVIGLFQEIHRVYASPLTAELIAELRVKYNNNLRFLDDVNVGDPLSKLMGDLVAFEGFTTVEGTPNAYLLKLGS